MKYLQRSVLVCLLLAMCSAAFAQSGQKYQGLLWEITGNNLAKPSYLFGTMHVSNKLAFHLSDSFYHCIRNADVVSLETDPQQLQEDFSKSKMLKLSSSYMTTMSRRSLMPKDAFTISSYGDLVRNGLTYRPEMINHLLYRSFSSQEDFEEDTFLDMYIYQVGSKLGKRATGVESFEESERLMLEAYRDAAKEAKTRKNNTSTYDISPAETRNLLNDAYRRGDLDLLDSLSNKQNSSPAFLEKFLYKRNENMFIAIDSIIRRSSLFAGVGAAHLPGERGLIHMLRKAGYTVRPISITNRDSEQKDQLEKMKAPVVFRPYVSDDGWIQAELPGKLYNFSNLTMLQQLQYADLANGAYYLVSRIKTNALSLGQSEQDVLQKIDSLLYENIPGKIISRQQIKNSGYTGFDIRNRTRRGDLQRYHIFATPFEIFIFKISGNGEYAAGEEADRFFASIRLKPMPMPEWSIYQPAEGSFSVKLPHQPVHSNNVALRSMSKRQEYEALDKKTGNSYLIIRKNIQDYSMLEEDTVELSFAEESFQQSQFIKQQKSRRLFTWLGHPCLEIVNQNTDNSYTQTRFLLQGANYYVLSARYQQDKKTAQEFFNTFTLRNPQYKNFQAHKDTALYFSVQTAVKGEDRDVAEEFVGNGNDEDEEEYTDYLYSVKEQKFQSDSTGETVHVSFQKIHRYYSVKDSAEYWNNKEKSLSNNGDLVVYAKKYEKLPGWESCLYQMRDTNSTKNFLYKIFLRKGAVYTLSSITDNISGPSAFITTFYDTFTPEDTLAGTSIYRSKTPLLLEDFYSKDSVFRKQARQSIVNVNYRDEDAPALIRMIKGWSASEKNYLEVKNDLLEQLGTIKHPEILPFLRQAYQAANDTSSLQFSILTALLHQQTRESHDVFRELVLKEIPVFGEMNQPSGLFTPLYDSLRLSAALFPDLMQFTALTDYKNQVYTLLSELADSGYIRPDVYKEQVNQIAFDARVHLQKQLSREQEANGQDEETELSIEAANYENYPLHNFAVMLLPYRNTNKNAERFFARYETMKNSGQQILRAQLYLRNKLPVSDSLLEDIAGREKYRVKLWEALEKIGMTGKFPAKYAKQESIARSVLYTTESYDTRIDTLVLLAKQQTTHRFRKGTVYIYKYRKKESDRWLLAVSGMQPENGNELSAADALTQLTELPFLADKPWQEQFTKAIRHVKYRNRYGWGPGSQSYDME